MLPRSESFKSACRTSLEVRCVVDVLEKRLAPATRKESGFLLSVLELEMEGCVFGLHALIHTTSCVGN